MPAIVDALDAAFYTAFENVEPTGKRFLLALDVSGSMTRGSVAGVPGLTPRDASAALALVTAATETRYETVGFYAGKSGWTSGGRRGSPAARRPDAAGDQPAAAARRRRAHGRAACRSAAPTVRCRCCTRSTREREIDTFVIYTDSETWAGDVHPAQALADYRRASGIDARLVVVGMVSNGFSIADPNDPGHARRRRFRHRDAAADLGLRPRRALTRGAPRAPHQSERRPGCTACTWSGPVKPTPRPGAEALGQGDRAAGSAARHAASCGLPASRPPGRRLRTRRAPERREPREGARRARSPRSD